MFRFSYRHSFIHLNRNNAVLGKLKYVLYTTALIVVCTYISIDYWVIP